MDHANGSQPPAHAQRHKRKKRKAAQATESIGPEKSADGKSPVIDKRQKAAETIDSIFAIRQTKPQPAQTHLPDETRAGHKMNCTVKGVVAGQSKRPVKGSKDDIFGEGPVQQRRVDEEGLPIYTADELNVGKGGGTAACPFDCKCCF